MNILTDLRQKTSYITFHTYQDFPENPIEGSLVFKDGIIYIYSNFLGSFSWYPLNVKSKTFTYTKDIPSVTWNISHGLNSQNLIYFIYDSNNILQMDSSITFTDNDNIILTFSTAITGRVVIFAEGDNYSGISTGSGTGSSIRNTKIITESYNMTDDDDILLINCSTSTINITLPDPSISTKKNRDIKKIDNTSYSVIINVNSDETIDGEINKTISSYNQSITLVTDNLNWYLI